jgi:spore germination cell wall hydrolase CwlJ-like protein
VSQLVAISAAVLVLFVTLAPAIADDVPVPLSMPDQVVARRLALDSEGQPKLTPALLAAYVERQQQLKTFAGFDVPEPGAELNETVLLGYIARRNNRALDAIENIAISDKPTLTAAVLADYAEGDFVPTTKRVKLADSEKLCLAQAIYHEARGESREGQLAVANVIINRAMSKKYPSTICGVVFQNADKGRYKCQFTFACDGRSDGGTERGAWNRSIQMAEAAFHDFQQGRTPDVLPKSALFYHTRQVSPSWSNSFRRVAAIGSHIFYSNTN